MIWRFYFKNLELASQKLSTLKKNTYKYLIIFQKLRFRSFLYVHTT